MIPGRAMFLLHNSEPELANLVADLEHLQSQGKWNDGLTTHLRRLAKMVAARKPPLNESRDKIEIDIAIRDMEDIVCSLLREQSDTA